jgi:lipid A 3-O-deacylase
MKNSIISFFFFFLFDTNLIAQKDSTGIKISTNRFVKINYENDFFTQTDEYYTQGIKLEGVDPVLRYSPIMWLLPNLSHSVLQYGLSAVQDCFTPTSITSVTILRGDQPFAGYVYLGHYKTSADYYKKQMLTAELDVGAIGSCAECEQEQKDIHRWFPGNVQPDGWQYQIGTGIMLNYKLGYEKALYSDTVLDIDACGQINAGTVYDNALAGFTIHVGKMQSHFFLNQASSFQFYGIIQAWAEGVAYNGTMQGDLFTNNSINTLAYKQISKLVFGDSYGLCLSFHKVTFVYSVTHITNEIITGYYHGWGHIDITYYL